MGNFNSKVAGKAFKIARVANDYTAKEAAEHAQVSSTYISEVESGIKTPSLNNFKKLSKVYNLSASQMMELIEYYECLEDSEQNELRKYQLTLIKALKMRLNID